MGLILTYQEGQTPLDPEQINGLKIKTISTQPQLNEFGLDKFSWGSSSLLDSSDQRKMYLMALKLADNGDFSELLKFARS